jgi:cellulose synthase/poly-beta-1,6-N-acetylglucosamine synthase-like glycosyltransferase
VLVTWVMLFLLAFGHGGVLAWSVGLAYLAYDAALQLFTAWQIRRFAAGDRVADGNVRVGLAVLVAAHNEAAVLPATLAALLAQADPPDEIVIADDGSSDETGAVLCAEFGLSGPSRGTRSDPIITGATQVVWLRLPQGGKSEALNTAILETDADVVVTVDADTLLDREAIGVVRRAFSREPELVGITGIITPVCGPSVAGQALQFFQTYEYIRNFLGRYAWMRIDCLQLISGAFAGFRRAAVVDIGGFDDRCLVEDYELVHRLRRYAGEHDLTWRFRVLGGAQARTEAPGSVPALLRQRRRWFGGFLQTQWWYRAMVGDRRMGRLGTVMLPIKAIDTVQPIYGLTAFALLIVFAATKQVEVLGPVALAIAGKLVIDLVFHLWSLRRYRQWVGDPHRASVVAAAAATIMEPFTFRLLLQCGAMLGWFAFLGGGQQWGRQERFGLTNEQ